MNETSPTAWGNTDRLLPNATECAGLPSGLREHGLGKSAEYREWVYGLRWR